MLIIKRYIHFLFFLLLLPIIGKVEVKYDEGATLITNVVIYDGTGSKPFDGSVLIKGEMIAEIYMGQNESHNVKNIIDG